MRGSIIFRIILVFVLLAAIAGLGYYAYSAGIANGMAQSAASATQGGATQTLPVIPYWYYGHPWGFPFFGFLGCLVPLFFLFLVFSALRGLFWGGWGWRRHGPWGMHHMSREDWKEGVPPFFSEWHRRAHGEPPADTAAKQSQ